MGGIVAYSWVGHRTWIRSVKHRNSRRHRGKVLFVLGPMEFARACGDTVPDDALRSPLISLLEDVEVPRISAEGKRIVDDTGQQASRITAPGRTEPPTIFAPGQPHHRVDFSRTAVPRRIRRRVDPNDYSIHFGRPGSRTSPSSRGSCSFCRGVQRWAVRVHGRRCLISENGGCHECFDHRCRARERRG